MIVQINVPRFCTWLIQCLSYEKPRSSVNRAPEPSQKLDNPAGGKGEGGGGAFDMVASESI